VAFREVLLNAGVHAKKHNSVVLCHFWSLFF